MPIEKNEFDSGNRLSKQVITLDAAEVELKAPDGTVICTIDAVEKSVTLGDGATSDGFGGSGGGLSVGDSLPETCSVGDTFLRTGNTGAGLYHCEVENEWTPSGELTTTVTLTNAQIKTLPTTPVEIVAAPGMGKVLFPQSAFLYAYYADPGGYDNVNASSKIAWSGEPTDLAPAIAETRSDLLLQNGQDISTMLPFYFDITGGSPKPQGGFIDPILTGPLKILATNATDGNFTGGNADNTLRVTVVYRVIPVS